MKTILLALSFIFILNSCTDNELPTDDVSQKTIIQQWKLYKMTGSYQGSETTGNEMAWQETYEFNADSTFSKTRVQNNETITASGTFTVSSEYSDIYQESKSGIILTYNEPNSIVASCNPDVTEYLAFNSKEDILYNSWWWACDGPGLFYQRD